MAKGLHERLGELVSRHSPGKIQKELSRIYEDLSGLAKTEPEAEFWFKCARASRNLSSGMDKWAVAMVDALEGDVDDSEGG